MAVLHRQYAENDGHRELRCSFSQCLVTAGMFARQGLIFGGRFPFRTNVYSALGT
jgi:hypothetical protein